MDSWGNARVKGWIVSADAALPDSIILTAGQGEDGREYPLSAETGALTEDNERLQDETFLAAVGDIYARYCWRFEVDISIAEWKKGALELDLECGDAVLARRTLISAVAGGRRNAHIAMLALSLLILVGCAYAILEINRRIRRVTEARIDPRSGESRLTERHREPPEQ